jgi:hypothetical protein
MSIFAKAIQNESEGSIVEAIKEYERGISGGAVFPVDGYINLAFAYWQCTDFGFAVAHKLGESLQQDAFSRCMEVLDQAEKFFPRYLEIRFWRLYFRLISLGTSEIDRTIDDIIADPNCNSVPFFYLYMARGICYRDKITELFAECEQVPTFKKRYILSILLSHVHKPCGQRIKES